MLVVIYATTGFTATALEFRRPKRSPWMNLYVMTAKGSNTELSKKSFTAFVSSPMTKASEYVVNEKRPYFPVQDLNIHRCTHRNQHELIL